MNIDEWLIRAAIIALILMMLVGTFWMFCTILWPHEYGANIFVR